jgi:hypothetical protein
VVRIIFPVGWVLKPLGFQLGHFPQYIALFILGLIAARSKWLNDADYENGQTHAHHSYLPYCNWLSTFFCGTKVLNFPVIGLSAVYTGNRRGMLSGSNWLALLL